MKIGVTYLQWTAEGDEVYFFSRLVLLEKVGISNLFIEKSP